MNDVLISLVLPIHNQADHVSRVVRDYEEALSRLHHAHEMILVVNGCRDRSLDVCRDLAEQYAPVRVIDSEKAGWGSAVKLGLTNARGELLCYTNAARTNAQDLVLLLLYALAYPNVVVKANRKIRESRRRRFGSLLYNLECRALFDLPYWDINGTPKVFPRAFDRLLLLTRDDDLIDAEFTMICRREGYPVVEVPIFSSLRHGGRSSTNYYSAVKMYGGAIQLWRTMRKGVA
jgi:glycosyltransferase involved in cell wall biosynthesis